MKNKRKRNLLYPVLALLFWIGLWQILSMVLDQEILLVSPGKVFLRFFALTAEADFWQRIAFSLFRILSGFLLAGFFGCLFSIMAYSGNIVRELFKPLMFVLKTTPVASFIILALIMVSSRNLSVLISFMMCLPVFYTNLLQGLDVQNKDLLEMAKVFRLSPCRTLIFVTLPQLRPYLFSAFSLSMGYAWKSGIAAEILGIPNGSLGERIYQAKLYFQTADLFAYTLAVILLSIGLEKAVTFLLKKLFKRKPQHMENTVLHKKGDSQS